MLLVSATQPIRLGFYLHRAQDDTGPKPTWQWAMPGTTAHDVLRAEQSLLGRTQIVTSLLDDHFVPLPLDALLEPSQTYTISSQPDEAVTPTEPFVVFVTWLQEQITYKAQPGMRLFQLAAALDLTQDPQWTDEEGIQLPLDVLLQPNALYAYHERPDPSPATNPTAPHHIEEPPVPTLYYGGMHTPAATSLAETPNDDSSVSHDSSVISTLETLRSATRGQRERGHENYATEYLNSADPFHLWRVQQLASHAPWLAHDEMAYHLTLLHRLRPGHSHVAMPLIYHKGALLNTPPRLPWRRILFTILIDTHWIGLEVAGFDTHWSWWWMGSTHIQRDLLFPLISPLVPPHLLDIRHHDIPWPGTYHLCGWLILQRWMSLVPLYPAGPQQWDDWKDTLEPPYKWLVESADSRLLKMLPDLTEDIILGNLILSLRRRYLLDIESVPPEDMLIWGGATSAKSKSSKSTPVTLTARRSRSPPSPPEEVTEFTTSGPNPEVPSATSPLSLERLRALAHEGHIDGYNLRDCYPPDQDWLEWRLLSLIRCHLWLGADEASFILRPLTWLRPSGMHFDGPFIWNGLAFHPQPSSPSWPAFAWLFLMDSHWFAIEGTYQDSYWRIYYVNLLKEQRGSAQEMVVTHIPTKCHTHVHIKVPLDHPPHTCGWALMHRWYTTLGVTLTHLEGFQQQLESMGGRKGQLYRDADYALQEILEETLEATPLRAFIKHCRQRFILDLDETTPRPAIYLGGVTPEQTSSSSPPVTPSAAGTYPPQTTPSPRVLRKSSAAAPPSTSSSTIAPSSTPPPLVSPEQRLALADATFRDTGSSLAVTNHDRVDEPWPLWRARLIQQFGSWIGQDEMMFHLGRLRWLHPEVHFAWPCQLRKGELVPLPTGLVPPVVCFTILHASHWYGVKAVRQGPHWLLHFFGVDDDLRFELEPLLASVLPSSPGPQVCKSIPIPALPHVCGFQVLQRWLQQVPLPLPVIRTYPKDLAAELNLALLATEADLRPHCSDPDLLHLAMALRQRFILSVPSGSPGWHVTLGGAKTPTLESLLLQHGVPTGAVSQRIQAIKDHLSPDLIKRVLADSQPWQALKHHSQQAHLRLVLPAELTAHIEARKRKGPGDNHKAPVHQAPPPLRADLLQIIPGWFYNHEDHPLEQLQVDTLVPTSSGVAFLDADHAPSWLKRTFQKPLLLLVVGWLQPTAAVP